MSDAVTFLYTDGSSLNNSAIDPGAASSAFVIVQEGEIVHQEGVNIGLGTSNVAEYKAVILGLRYAIDLGIRRIKVLSDSQLVVRQMMGEYKVKNSIMKELHNSCLRLADEFDSVTFEHVKGHAGDKFNELADSLCTAVHKIKSTAKRQQSLW
jgi:ribonuclease HI